jgi:mRNA-degrading endonuclease HigB of HigAB toxin-antitoxin module
MLLTFPGAGVLLGILTAHREALSVSDAAIASDFHKPFDAKHIFPLKVSFHPDIVFDIFADKSYLILGKVSDPDVGVYVSIL